ncbi:MAG: DUF4380 domain-containing protein [Cyanobacteria bacterium P01_A01_bin.123]
MSSLSLKYAEYAGWPDALWIEAERLTLMLVPQVGGRVMGLHWYNYPIYWVNPSLGGKPIDVALITPPATAKADLGFLLWGGSKTWLAPQDRWHSGLPFLDLDSGAYRLNVLEEVDTQVSVVMTSPICRETGVQLTRTISLGTEVDCWQVTHQMTNCSDRSTTWGLWSNVMVRRPATVFLPTRDSSQFPDGVKTFESEGDSIQARSQVMTWQDSQVAIRCDRPIKFKFGVDSELGQLLAVYPLPDGQFLGHVKQFNTFHPESYGHGCVIEVFNAVEYPYLELEIHDSVHTLAPGESRTFVETNRLVTLNAMPTTTTDINAVVMLGELC